MTRSTIAALVASCNLLALGACDGIKSLGDPSVADTEGDDSSADSGEATTNEDEADEEGYDDVELNPANGVDILLVFDNSGSMGEEQKLVAHGLSYLVENIEASGVSVRLGVTTTDNGNPRCSGTTPEAGRLVLQSCRDRLDDFVFTDTNVQEAGCQSTCSLTSEELGLDSDTPWIEWSDGGGNFDPQADLEDALGCVIPQGINGCGFESPLEAQFKAIERTRLPDEESFGFLREDAALLILHVTDEADCSANPDAQSVFLEDGHKVFWGNPDEPPTSAICWNAGVSCVEGDGGTMECSSANYDIHGELTADPESAVLRPLSRYRDQLYELTSAGKPVLFGVIAGFDSDGGVNYEDVSTTDPNTHLTFGIGAGCVGRGGAQVAIPPVRLRELAFESSELGIVGVAHSICDDDYEPMLGQLSQRIVEAQGE